MSIFWKYVEKIQVSLKSDKNGGHFIWRPTYPSKYNAHKPNTQTLYVRSEDGQYVWSKHVVEIKKRTVESKRPTWCHLLFLFHFTCAQHVSDINISIIRSLRLFCWITTLVVCSWFDVCSSFGVVVLGWYPCCTPTQPDRNTNTHRTKNTRPMW